MKSKISQRKEAKATCPKCKSPDYKFYGLGDFGHFEFKCNSCNHFWSYGKTESKFTKKQ